MDVDSAPSEKTSSNRTSQPRIQNETEKVKTMGNLSFNSLITSLSERSRQDLISSFLDVLTLTEQRTLLENLSNRVNRGVHAINNEYHYVIINSTICKHLTKTNSLRIIYQNAENQYSDEPDRIQILFISATKQFHGTESNIEEFNCKETAFDNVNVGEPVFYISPECDVVHQKLLEKDPINHRFINGVCFKVDPTGIMVDPETNDRKLIQTPMKMYLINHLTYLVISTIPYDDDELVPRDECQRLYDRNPSETFEFVINVDNQDRRILYMNFM